MNLYFVEVFKRDGRIKFGHAVEYRKIEAESAEGAAIKAMAHVKGVDKNLSPVVYLATPTNRRAE